MDSRLRAIEPALEAITEMGKAQLFITGGVEPDFMVKFATDIYEIQRTLVNKEKDVRAKSQRIVGSGLIKEFIEGLMKAGSW